MKYFVLSLLLITASSVLSQKYLLPYRIAEKWGYADLQGQILIEPQYDSVSVIQENSRWNVFKHGKIGVIDCKGNELLKPIYSTIMRDPKHSEYHDYYIQFDSFWGYANMNGKVLIEPKYHEIITCDYDYRYEFKEVYNFIVSESNDENTYAIIDTNETVYVRGISEIDHLSGPFYQFKIESNWGVYNVTSHKWSIENRFDSIVRFPTYYTNYGDVIEKPYSFYVKEKNKIFLISSDFEIVGSSKEKLDSLLMSPLVQDGENESYSVSTLVEAMISPDAKFRDLSTFPISPSGDIEFENGYSDNIGSIRLLKHKKSVGLEIISFGPNTIEPEYDAFYAFVDKKNRINHSYFLIRKNKKWGVYDLAKDRIVVPVEQDSIVPGYYNDNLEIYKNGSMGIFLMGEIYHDAPNYFFLPEFDRLRSRNYARSNDFEYNSLNIYFFEKDGVIYPISQYGVKLFE